MKSPSYRSYHTALLEYVLGSGEPGLAHAYELGRTALYGGCGLLHILNVHEKAVNAILQSTPAGDEFRRRVNASVKFLVEALSPFEMACHGYFDLLKASEGKTHQRPSPRASSHDRG